MIILGILLFALLVIVHEYGHFVAARKSGVEVEEFGIGFPPRLFAKKRGSTLFTFNLLPLGGFVKLKGESNAATEPGSFGAVAYFSKAKILLAGVFMNLVATFAILALLAFVGMPKVMEGQFSIPADEKVISDNVVVAQVVEDSAAEQVGLEIADGIISIDGVMIDKAATLSEVTSDKTGQTVQLVYERDGQQRQAEVTLGTDDSKGQLGVAPINLETARYTWSAPLVAVGLTLQMIWLILSALGSVIFKLFTGAGEAAAGLTGPVGIVFLLQNLGKFGLEYLLFLIASISASLAVFNALPIPALDGGRLTVITGAKMLKKRLTTETENAIHGIGFILLMIVFAAITYVDVQRFF